MNEIEERNGLDPEVAESIRPTAEEVAQSATDMAESHVEPIESLPDSEDSSPLSKEEEELLAQVMEEAHNEIPTNSGSLLIDESTSRFSSAIWYEAIQRKVVILAGVGGIGRFGNLINF